MNKKKSEQFIERKQDRIKRLEREKQEFMVKEQERKDKEFEDSLRDLRYDQAQGGIKKRVRPLRGKHTKLKAIAKERKEDQQEKSNALTERAANKVKS